MLADVWLCMCRLINPLPFWQCEILAPLPVLSWGDSTDRKSDTENSYSRECETAWPELKLMHGGEVRK